VVVLGTGWGAIGAVKKIDTSEFDVTVVSPRPFFFYTPLLCGSTVGTVSTRAIIESIRESITGIHYVRASCEGVDLEQKKVICSDSGTNAKVAVDYDHLVVAVGAQPNTFGIPGVDKHGMFLKEISHAVAVRKRLLNCFESAALAYRAGDIDNVKRLLHFVVVGGGPTGVEFSAELSDFLRNDVDPHFPEVKKYCKVSLLEALPGILTMFDKSVGQYVSGHLLKNGVQVRTKTMVKNVEETNVTVKTEGGEETFDYGMLVWVAGVGMRPFTKAVREQIGQEAGQTDRRGLVVDECLRVKGCPPGEVFALGDCAISGKPPTAQVAAQQGKYLGRMFRLGQSHLLADPEAPSFQYNHQGTMAYIGEGQAAADINPNSFIGLGKTSLTDHIFWRSLYGDTDKLQLLGPVGFAVWRSAYFSKIFGPRNRFTVASDWVRTLCFGRPVASPVQSAA